MRNPTPLDALKAHRNTVIRANGYLETLPKGDGPEELMRSEAHVRNRGILERLAREIVDESGELEVAAPAPLRRRDVADDAGDYKSYGRADW